MKDNKLFRVLRAVMFAILLALPFPATPALAVGETITLSSQGVTTSQGAIGQEITISGSGFYGTAANETASRGVIILFGKHPGSAIMDYSAAIYERIKIAELSNGTFQTTFPVPSRLSGGTTKEDVVTGSYYVFLTYYYPGSPPIDGLSVILIAPFNVVAGSITLQPGSGAIGTEVSINGTYLGLNEPIVVSYDGFEAPITGDKDTDGSGAFGVTKITIPPSTAGPHLIRVTANNSGISAQANFTVKPTISIAPSSGAAGTLITVKGNGFSGGSAIGINFDNEALTPGNSDTAGSFVMNAVALSRAPGNYTITTSDGKGNSATATFAVTASGIKLSPSAGLAGTAVSLTGSGFIASRPITITFNDAKVASSTSDAQGAFSANFTVPALAAATYKIKATDGSNTSEADFAISLTVDITPKTSQASPGYIGSELTVTGAGATPGSTVTITYDGTQVATASVNADKTFSATFKVPASSAGEHTIVASIDPARKFTFVMESTPPAIPLPLKPEMNIKTKPATFFDWDDVTDPSGVTYTLRIATARDFSPSSIALEKTGISLSQYTLSDEEKLKPTTKQAPYYWHVKAVDGAGNQSGWSGTGAFSVGGGLSQPVIYFLIGIGALAVIIFAFWLGKRISSR